MPKIQFTVRLESAERGSGVFFTLPRKESAKFGVRGRVPVTGSLNGYGFRSSIFPTGDGAHYMGVNREVREGAGVEAGDRVRVIMEVDTKPRTVAVPADLDKALAKSKPHARASTNSPTRSAKSTSSGSKRRSVQRHAPVASRKFSRASRQSEIDPLPGDISRHPRAQAEPIC